MKCQLETAGVWTAWGMACIKAGEFLSAREKFRHCLKVFAYFITNYKLIIIRGVASLLVEDLIF